MPSIDEVLNGHRTTITPNDLSTYQSFISSSSQGYAYFKSTSLIESYISTKPELSTSTIKLNVLSSSVSTNYYGTYILKDSFISTSLIIAVIFLLVLIIYLGKIIKKTF